MPFRAVDAANAVYQRQKWRVASRPDVTRQAHLSIGGRCCCDERLWLHSSLRLARILVSQKWRKMRSPLLCQRGAFFSRKRAKWLFRSEKGESIMLHRIVGLIFAASL